MTLSVAGTPNVYLFINKSCSHAQYELECWCRNVLLVYLWAQKVRFDGCIKCTQHTYIYSLLFTRHTHMKSEQRQMLLAKWCCCSLSVSFERMWSTKKNREREKRKLQANSCDSILTHIVKNVAWFDKSGGFVLVDRDSTHEGARLNAYASLLFFVIHINCNTPAPMRHIRYSLFVSHIIPSNT